MTLYQCSFCENSYDSDDVRQKHEKVCVKNGQTEKERFEAKIKQKANP